jgi:surface protein
MYGLFSNCYALSSVNLSGWDTSNVTRMGGASINSGMFASCYALKTINISHFNTSKVTDMRNMFWTCGVTNLKLNFDMSSITDANMVSSMFYNCKISAGSIKFTNVKTSVFTNKATFINAISGSGINSAILTVSFV